MTIDTHNLLIDFGKHKGQPYTRAPISYLRWMVNSGHSRAEVAIAELNRRGMPLVDAPIEISGHAIDSASLRLWKNYRDTRKSPREGLHAWLMRMCVEAISENDIGEDNDVYYQDIKLVLFKGDLHYTLKTVMKDK